MKNKILAAIPGVLTAVHAVVPLCLLAAVLSGRYLQLNSPLFIAILLSALTLASLIVMLVFRAEYGWANSLTLSFALLFSAVTQFYFILHAVRVYEGYDTTAPAIVFAVNTIAMIVLFIKVIDDSWYKAAFGVITVLFAMAAVAYAGYLLVSGSLFGEKRYAEGPASPDGGYRTYVSFRESGLATDGASYVYTVRTEESGVPFGKLKYPPKRIYSGGKLAYENMRIAWIDGETLLVDGEICSAEKSPEENKKSAEPENASSSAVSEPVSEPADESSGQESSAVETSAAESASGAESESD
ncbi:MAG: hypothetical protein IJQ53_06280 [Clostridia bacterium]|nr:hypothetical protein [Clostridia bacterium]